MLIANPCTIRIALIKRIKSRIKITVGPAPI
jgi:hypothetical protein